MGKDLMGEGTSKLRDRVVSFIDSFIGVSIYSSM